MKKIQKKNEHIKIQANKIIRNSIRKICVLYKW